MQFWELSKSLVPINHELYSRSCDFQYEFETRATVALFLSLPLSFTSPLPCCAHVRKLHQPVALFRSAMNKCANIQTFIAQTFATLHKLPKKSHFIDDFVHCFLVHLFSIDFFETFCKKLISSSNHLFIFTAGAFTVTSYTVFIRLSAEPRVSVHPQRSPASIQ